MLWVRQHVVTFSREQEQDRLWERARVYARHAYQAPSWTVRATQAMLVLRRSPPRLISIPRQSCAAQDSQESRPEQASRLSVQQTPDTNNKDSQASTSRSTEALNPPRAAAKKRSLFDLLRSENFSDSLLGCRRVQHRRI
ncbi:7866_t:CDS:2 [Paraglomus occultum]|uniref:7866_t:CDS:1 n=1 Tax=Paraglomus occultum TaxID=144539 RepID=A0A9N8WJN8_9GLOM|nr:7866_t:CDS:2 [Paraglomus occultum]